MILTRKQATLIVWIAFVFAVVIRLPQLFHPLAHHYESITALELVAIESWKQAGGPNKFFGLPPINYQQTGDKQLPNGIDIDTRGNEVYISYGSLWNLTPYYFFSWLRISPGPIALRLLNICIGLLTCIMVFKLVLLISADSPLKYTSASIASTVFVLAPANLWYFCNVYVNCGFAIPFILAFMYWVVKMMTQTSGISLSGLIILLLVTVSLFLTDWIACFIAATSLILILFNIKKNRKLLYPMLIIVIGIGGGAAIFVWQAFSLLGSSTAMKNLSGKFLFRTAGLSASTFSIVKDISIHFITAFLPLLVLLILLPLIAFARRKSIQINTPSKLFYQILLPALILYNLIFLSWTKIHEFSILYYGPVFAIAIGNILPGLFNGKVICITMLASTVFCAAEFYLINPPGTTGLNKVPYDTYKKLGLDIARRTNKEQVIFSNIRMLPPVTYYAKRLVTYSNSPEEAKQRLYRFKSDQAVWIDVKNLEVAGIYYLNK